MSTRQIARAAVEGRQVTFSFTTLPDVTGYVVGADDYHWFVINPSGNNPTLSPETLLVHKGSAAVVRIHTEPTLVQDPERDFITKVGSSFWAFCNRAYFNNNHTIETLLEPAS